MIADVVPWAIDAVVLFLGMGALFLVISALSERHLGETKMPKDGPLSVFLDDSPEDGSSHDSEE